MKEGFESLSPDKQEALIRTMNEMEEMRSGPPEKTAPAPPKFDPNKDLHTVSMEDLYDMTFPPRSPLIEGMLYSGTYIFAGSPKIGKSFFMMQLAYHVAMGIPLWEYPVRQGTVLYLALEDDLGRLQGRLVQMFGVESTPNLILTTESRTLAGGLTEQMDRFVQRNPETRLIIVDTLQRVREDGNENYSYAMDYQNITAFKEFSDKYNLCLMVVHHTRKMDANDSFETISGTTGLLGAADGAVILQKKKRIENTATMQIVGRDQEDQELEIEFDRDRCIWNLVKAEKTIFKKPPDPIIMIIADFMKDKTEWTGTAGELLEAVPDIPIKPNTLTRKLNVNVSALFNDFGIAYIQNDRSRERRTFTLKKIETEPEKPAQDDDKGCDDKGSI